MWRWHPIDRGGRVWRKGMRRWIQEGVVEHRLCPFATRSDHHRIVVYPTRRRSGPWRDGEPRVKILGIETSCDETAAAVVDSGRDIACSVIASQVKDHRPYGGVVPELASRKHIEAIGPVVNQALEQARERGLEVEAVAATQGPGLVGALLVGFCHAKALADARRVLGLLERVPGVVPRWLDTGCCGMAGAFGMLSAHRELSHQVGEPLQRLVEALPVGATVVASGTSCRHQIGDLTDVRPLHVAELLARHLAPPS